MRCNTVIVQGLRTIDEVEVIYSNGGAACTDGITNEISIRFLTEVRLRDQSRFGEHEWLLRCCNV